MQNLRRVLLVGVVLVLLAAVPASAKTLNRAVLVGADGRWVRITSTAADFEDLARDPSSERQRVKGGFLRLYYVGPGDFPANRAPYYPGQRCIALDWPSYERSCRAVRQELIPLFERSHPLPRFTVRPTVLTRLRLTYTSASVRTRGLYGLTGAIELALSRNGVAIARPSGCYALTGAWDGPAATLRPKRLSLCRGGVYANGHLHALNRGVWVWFGLNV